MIVSRWTLVWCLGVSPLQPDIGTKGKSSRNTGETRWCGDWPAHSFPVTICWICFEWSGVSTPDAVLVLFCRGGKGYSAKWSHGVGILLLLKIWVIACNNFPGFEQEFKRRWKRGQSCSSMACRWAFFSYDSWSDTCLLILNWHQWRWWGRRRWAFLRHAGLLVVVKGDHEFHLRNLFCFHASFCSGFVFFTHAKCKSQRIRKQWSILADEFNVLRVDRDVTKLREAESVVLTLTYHAA